MKFLDVRCYIVFNVYIAYFSDLAAFGADGVGLCSPVAFLVFRYCPELVVGYQVGLYEHCDGVVYGSTAYAELRILFEILHKLLYLETAVD